MISRLLPAVLCFLVLQPLSAQTSDAPADASPVSTPSKPDTVTAPSAPIAPSAPAAPAKEMRKSLVRIACTEQDVDYKVPWNPGPVGGGVGAGFVIEGNRILTNAHVVSNNRFLTVERQGDPKKYVAYVKYIAHDCDLALIDVENPDFFKGSSPLTFGGIPEIETVVSAYGFPIGGDLMSVTRGIVSRIDFQPYTHSGIDSHLAIQIDAPINPGNSGGPVMQDGKVVGVAFQGYSGDHAQNVAYMIPTPVVNRFLRDIEDGRYDHYVDLSLNYFKLVNPAQRAALKLPDDDRGIIVTSVAAAGSSAGVLQPGDILLSLDDVPIASDGFVQLGNDRIEMMEIVERKFKGDTVVFQLIRDGKPHTAKVTLKSAWPYLMQANTYDKPPRYVLFAGLLFQPINRDFMTAVPIDDLRTRYFYNSYITEELYVLHPDLVVLSNILPDPVNTYLGEFRGHIVESINGKPIKVLDDLASALSEKQDTYVIQFLGGGRPAVLERSVVEAARTRILDRYNVTKEQNLANPVVPSK
ncbi:MAG TPA: trypsin-like peptidase domain-containing protein [Chthoniobacterales bacterium]|jgi:S1-C subfamily serine protease